MTFLILEDEARTALELRSGMEAAGMAAQVAPTAEEALSLLTSQSFEAMVVDVMLPGLSGLDLVQRLRAAKNLTPVLFLSAKGSLEDRLRGLEIGGNDYLAKPYSILEVVARLRALTRHQSPPPPPRVEVADLVWEPELRRITRSGQRIDLSPREYTLMTLLLAQVGKVIGKTQYIQALWGMDNPVDPGAVAVQINRLRKKVDDPFPVKLIHTLRGVGLVLDPREHR